MCQELIRANRQWEGKPQHDTVFIKVNDVGDKDAECSDIMHGMLIAHVQLFFSFHDPVLHEEIPCALVNCFTPVSDQRDEVMGMWEFKPEMVGTRPTL